ncbi:MAG TPA: galactitol-1-phosphate 5-dehydrogenase [Fimbriimonas sp.]
MKALSLHGVGDLRLIDVPTPAPKAGEALVRVAACGVCGSDIPRIFSKGTYRFPTIPGHEFAGTIAEKGPGVEGLEVGDAVAVFPLLWCGECAPCESGRYVQCENYGYLGSRDDGAFAEYVVAPSRNLAKVPAGVSLEEAALTEPASVALHALRRTGRSLFGLNVAVYGAGPIGLMVAQWARSMGAAEVLIFDIAPRKAELARSLGFSQVFDSPAETTAHVCIEAAGVPATMLAACRSVARGGTVVLLGNPSRDLELPADLVSQLMRKEASLLGTWNSDYSSLGTGDDWHAVLHAVRAKKIDLTTLVSHRVSLDEALPALEQMRDHPDRVSKILIKP